MIGLESFAHVNRADVGFEYKLLSDWLLIVYRGMWLKLNHWQLLLDTPYDLTHTSRRCPKRAIDKEEGRGNAIKRGKGQTPLNTNVF